MTTKKTVTRPRTWFQRMFGLPAIAEVMEFATEQELVDSGELFPLHDDIASNRIFACHHCKKPTIARRRRYEVGTWLGGNDFGPELAAVYSCLDCGTLYEPTNEHRVNYIAD